MDWFIFALIAPMLWAIVVIIDDNLLRKVYKSASFGSAISGLFGLLPAAVLFAINDKIFIETKYMISAIIAGFLTVIFYYYYLRILNAEEPSVAIALFSLAPACVPLLAKIFLNESLNTKQYIGIAIILAAALLLTIVDIKKLKFSSVIIYAVLGSLAYAVVSISAKYAYQGGSFSEVYAWIAVGFGFGGLLFLTNAKNIKDFKNIIGSASKKIIIILIAAELINILAEVVQGYAINGGPVSIVRAIEGIQPIYILLFGVLLSPFYPKLFREVADKRFRKKITIMTIMIFGLLLVHSGTNV